MAVVYLCEDTSLMREVALKSLSPQYASDESFRERFQREGRILARVRHESIVPIFDFGVHDDVPYIVMEYMPGGTLADRIENDSLTVDSSLEILRRVASALDAAHAAGVIHRDLKPANILFDNEGRAFVGDFGVGRMDGISTGVTLPGTVIGTAQYMSPEQVNGAPPTTAADIYSFGALTYETLVGRAPFRGDNVWGIMRQHLEDTPRPPGEINPALAFADEPVLTAMSKDPTMRPRSARAITDQLDAGYQSRDQRSRAEEIELTPTVVPGMAALSRQPTMTAPSDDPLPVPQPVAAPAQRPPSMAGAPPARRGSHLRTIIIAAVGAALVAGGIAVAAGLLLGGGDDDDGTPAGNGTETTEPAEDTPTSEGSGTADSTESATSTETEVPATQTRLPEGEILVAETFDDPAATSIPQPTGTSGRGFVQDGRYFAEDFSADDNIYTPVEFKTGAVNHSIGADAFSPEGVIILTCRGDERFDVRFIVRPGTSEFRTQVLDKRESKITTLQDWTSSSSIKAGESNRYELFCNGDRMDAVANTVVLSSHNIPGIEGDGVSFGVDGGVQATFDNVEIRKQ